MSPKHKKEIPISINDNHHSIIIGSGLLREISKYFLFNKYSKIAILADINTKKYWLPTLKNGIRKNIIPIIIPPNEKISKSLYWIEKIWIQMIDNKLDRHSLLINLGGGTICDMGGFVASTFMRGIDFLNIPTTLLSQADAGFGGKTGFNFAGIKNLIGIFSHPTSTIIDIKTIITLPKREFLSGFGEIIKHGLVKNKDYFDEVTSKHPLLFTPEELIAVVTGSCKIKTSVVRNDERDQNTRKILNFGHTIGHAIESICSEKSISLLHGEAISIGILAEATISYLMGLLSFSELKRIKKTLINAELPTSIKGIKTNKILEKIRSDKKNIGNNINFTLLNGIGKALQDQIVPETIIIEAIKEI